MVRSADERRTRTAWRAALLRAVIEALAVSRLLAGDHEPVAEVELDGAPVHGRDVELEAPRPRGVERPHGLRQQRHAQAPAAEGGIACDRVDEAVLAPGGEPDSGAGDQPI